MPDYSTGGIATKILPQTTYSREFTLSEGLKNSKIRASHIVRDDHDD